MLCNITYTSVRTVVYATGTAARLYEPVYATGTAASLVSYSLDVSRPQRGAQD
jgi:hypothetical protein